MKRSSKSWNWNPGRYGTPTRAITEHTKALHMAAAILAAEHGKVHQAGERADLCPKCREEKPT